METMVSYLFKSIIISCILTCYYWFVLRNKKFHQYNRFYLLSAITISIVAPFLHFGWFSIQQPANEFAGKILSVINPDELSGQNFYFTGSGILTGAIIFISTFLVMTLLARIAWVYYQKRKHPNIRMDGFNLIETELKQAPFSFLNNLFWKKSIFMGDENGNKIFRHELTHIREKHTYDKLFSQVASCIFWMNPFYWIIQKELNVIHEFIADEKSIPAGDVVAFAQMLLQSHNEGRYLDPMHTFFQSPIKRRLIMITTSKRTTYSYIRRVLVLPITMLAFAMFSFTVSKAQSNSSSKQETANQKQQDERASMKNKTKTKDNKVEGKNKLKDEKMAKEATQREAEAKEASQKEASQKEASQKEASQKEANQKEAAEKEANLKKEKDKKK